MPENLNELNKRLAELRLAAAEAKVFAETNIESLNAILKVIPEKVDEGSLSVLGVILDRAIKIQKNVGLLAASCDRAYETLGDNLAEARRLLDAEQQPE